MTLTTAGVYGAMFPIGLGTTYGAPDSCAEEAGGALGFVGDFAGSSDSSPIGGRSGYRGLGPD